MKASDDVLKTLGHRARETDPLADPRWDSLAAGTLSLEDAAELRARADGGEVPEATFEAFRPIDDAERARMTDAVLSRVGAASLPQDAVEAAAPAIDVREASRRRPRLVARLVPAAVTALAAAAALLLWVRQPPLAPLGPLSDLPRYEAVVQGGQSAVRGAPAPVPAGPRWALAPRSRLRVILRPATSVAGPLAVRALARRDGALHALSGLSAQAEPEGTFLVEGSREELFAGEAEGDLDLVFLVGRPESLPEGTALLDRMRQRGTIRLADPPTTEAGDGAMRVVVVPVRIAGP